MCACKQGTCPGDCGCGCVHSPWPIVSECYDSGGLCSCPQHACVGHDWAPWRKNRNSSSPSGGPGAPVRCRRCGARKCDFRDCGLIRYHRGDHGGIPASPMCKFVKQCHGVCAKLSEHDQGCPTTDVPLDRQPATVAAWLDS